VRDIGAEAPELFDMQQQLAPDQFLIRFGQGRDLGDGFFQNLCHREHSITSPDFATADKNLGIKTLLNGTLVSDIVLDTTQVATDTVDYVATLPAQAGDPNGLTSTSSRTVIVEASPALPVAASSSTPVVAVTSTGL
jgi:hypothetical protein